MNKKLIGMITSALVIGAASTALANPFADVPADHWAYDAIDQLAADGVIEGYNDGTFAGDKAITRYEMAQIVARAMANCDGADAADKATIDKLAAEFSTELDALGVRVDNLEKKVAGLKNITPYGDMRIRYNILDGADKGAVNNGADKIHYRARLGFKGDVNKDLAFNMRIMLANHDQWGGDNWSANKDGANINKLVNAEMTWKNVFKNTNLTFGRFSQDLGATMYLLNSIGDVDGAKLTHKAGKWDVDLGYADFGSTAAGAFSREAIDKTGQAMFLDAKYKPSNKLTLHGMYFKTDGAAADPDVNYAADTFSVGAEWNFAKNLYLLGEYAQNSEIDGAGDDGSTIRLRYGNVSAAKPGSYMVFIERNDWNEGLLGSQNISGNSGECMGKCFETNWQIGFDMALAKNVVWQNWYAFDRTTQNNAEKEDFCRTQINFSF